VFGHWLGALLIVERRLHYQEGVINLGHQVVSEEIVTNKNVLFG
jgi:hypothetical protein